MNILSENGVESMTSHSRVSHDVIYLIWKTSWRGGPLMGNTLCSLYCYSIM